MAKGSTSSNGAVWRGVAWAWGEQRGRAALGARAVLAALRHGKPLRRWLAAVSDLRSRGLIDDERREYLRALRPFVHRQTDVGARVAQLIDHLDWMETAFQPDAYEGLVRGQPLVLAELPPPRGYDAVQLRLQRNVRQSPEGELLLTLSVRRSAQVQPAAPSLDVAVLAFTRIRLDTVPTLAIGGVRGQRDASRMSATEVTQVLQGWKAPVLMVRVAQELARYWGLQLAGLDPSWHRLRAWPYNWRRSHREAAKRIFTSYEALWDHFGGRWGMPGWVMLPLNSDEKLEATALSDEKRSRQTRRADYWIRTRTLLRDEFGRRLVLLAPGRGGVTQNLGPRTVAQNDWELRDFRNSSEVVPSRSMDTGPGALE
ncbi:DUF535 family protein [Ramlibacter humi]|uniref:DUF535 domain-containing protein n=1 Tax=Ramlibacter humi TaxID=2530451 RepID=A0A4Z0BT92_9BURK|nr:DUF535 family protein [Ramlibacter humi]TFZ02061.1 DUF535 domain-containing protein [Ramlibacter humi]